MKPISKVVMALSRMGGAFFYYVEDKKGVKFCQFRPMNDKNKKLFESIGELINDENEETKKESEMVRANRKQAGH